MDEAFFMHVGDTVKELPQNLNYLFFLEDVEFGFEAK
jgi:hypothetical protein